MRLVWESCDFETFNNRKLRAEFAALSRIGCSALSCVSVDPDAEPLQSFERLISLFCVVSENVSVFTDTLESAGEKTDQLSQTVNALNALPEFTQAVLFAEGELESRIIIYADAAMKIHGGLPADGNPIVEIVA